MGLYGDYSGVIWGLYRDYSGGIWGLYRDNGKEHGNYCNYIYDCIFLGLEGIGVSLRLWVSE